jgi:hypothetical protein
MTTTHTIKWERTGLKSSIVHENDVHNWMEMVEGVDQNGIEFKGIGEIVDGVIENVELTDVIIR